MLPPRGGVRDDVLHLLHQRELNENYLRTQLSMMIQARGAGVPDDLLKAMLEEYRVELFQIKYTPTYFRAVTQKKVDDLQRLKRLDRYTVTDADLPPPPKNPGRRLKPKRRK